MRTIFRGLRMLLVLAGVMFTLYLLIGFFGLPSSWIEWLTGGRIPVPADYRTVVVLGGAGIPSESGLIRTYHGAKLAAGKSGVRCVVALPCEIDPDEGSVGKMRDELVMRGVSRKAVLMECRGINTHEQAVNIARMLGPAAVKEPVVLVTSPLHIRRSLKCFRHEGFTRVVGFAAVSGDVEADVGPNALLRYSFWGNLETALRVAREALALALYRIKGWI